MLSTRRLIIIVYVFALALSPLVAPAQGLRTNDILKLIHDSSSIDYRTFMLDKLRSNRIVMLADEGHGVAIYYQTVIDIMNEWATAWEHDRQANISSGLPRKLYLVLEADSLFIGTVEKYFASGNLIDLVDPEFFMGYQFTTASLQFYSDLRSLMLRIDSLNRNYSGDQLLEFKLVGPEKPIDTSDWSAERRDKYFAFERDEYSSSKLIQLLDSQPTAKLLIFYGSAHFLLGQQPKPPEKPVGKGYYLAHYLVERFRNQGGTYICDQVSMPSVWWLDPAFERATKSFAMENSCWRGVSISYNATFPQFDGAIYLPVKASQSKHISKILAESLVDLILARIDKYRNTKNEFSRYYLKLWFTYLSIFTDSDYAPVNPSDSSAVAKAIDELKQWRHSTKLDVVQEMQNLKMWRRMVDRIGSSQEQQSTQYQMYLGGYIGFKVWFQSGASPQVRAEAVWSSIQRYQRSITLDNLVGLLWLGSIEERERALSILRRETSQNLSTPREWEQWLVSSSN